MQTRAIVLYGSASFSWNKWNWPRCDRVVNFVGEFEGVRAADGRHTRTGMHTEGRCRRPKAKGNDYIGGIRSAHGWALSSCAAKRMSVASSPKREEKRTPMGRPSGVECSGTDIEGCPDAL